MDKLEKNLSFDEICLVAVDKSTISSRKYTTPTSADDDNIIKQRVFISPMTCLLDESNYDRVRLSQFIPIYPVRYDNFEIRKERMQRGEWVAMTTKELEDMIKFVSPSNSIKWRICLDTAQGQREDLYDLIYIFKSTFKNSELMVGNIMTGGAYLECAKAGADYVRCSVGTGGGCITSVLTGFHRSMPKILNEINIVKQNIKDIGEGQWLYGKGMISGEILKSVPAVVADGGLNSIDKIIKAYALGADYVMIGSLFAQTEAACGKLLGGRLLDKREYYGQASQQGQLDRFGEVRNEPEGIKKWIPINWEFEKLQKKLNDILRSAMSYAGARNMNEFIGKVKFEEQSIEEYNSYNK